MNGRDMIRHPGPETVQRVVSAIGNVVEHSVTIKAGQVLMEAVGQLMDSVGCDSAVVVLDGVNVGPFDYVMPSYSTDKTHAAWYSDTYSCDSATLRNATAMVGQRDGAWWLHCHAIWDAESTCGMGHLLPDSVTLAADSTVRLLAFIGGRFEVALDPETCFPIFHAHGGYERGNALIAKVNPHEDIHTAIEQLINDTGYEHASILGIGSLIGARFEKGPCMESPISEVLIAPGASWNGSLKLPMHCVDTESTLFHGTIVKSGAPVLVTFELMIVEA